MLRGGRAFYGSQFEIRYEIANMVVETSFTERANMVQVIICFAQGVLWQLILNGWRHWNKSAKFSGKNVGSRIRRWWWGVNGWAIPTAQEVSVDFLNVGIPVQVPIRV